MKNDDWRLYATIDENGKFTHLEQKKKEDAKLEHQKSIDEMLEAEFISNIDKYEYDYAEYWSYC